MNIKKIKLNLLNAYVTNRELFNFIHTIDYKLIMQITTYFIKHDFHSSYISTPIESFSSCKQLLLRDKISQLCIKYKSIQFSLNPTLLLFSMNKPRVQFCNIVEGITFLLTLFHTSNLNLYLEQKFPSDLILQYQVKVQYVRWDSQLLNLIKSPFHEKLQQIRKDYFLLELQFENPIQECSSLQSPVKTFNFRQNTPLSQNLFKYPQAPNHDIKLRQRAKSAYQIK